MKKPRPDFVITADVYSVEIGVWLDRDGLLAWRSARGLVKDGHKMTEGSTIACACWDVAPDGTAWFNVFISPDCKYTTVSHECLHAAWFVLQEHGVEVTGDNHEALAYLQEHLTKQILKHFPAS